MIAALAIFFLCIIGVMIILSLLWLLPSFRNIMLPSLVGVLCFVSGIYFLFSSHFFRGADRYIKPGDSWYIVTFIANKTFALLSIIAGVGLLFFAFRHVKAKLTGEKVTDIEDLKK